MSESLFESNSLSWVAMVNMTKIELELISDADIHLSLEKTTEKEFLKFLRDVAKSILSIWNLMTQSVLYTATQITYIVMRYLSFFQQVDSTG